MLPLLCSQYASLCSMKNRKNMDGNRRKWQVFYIYIYVCIYREPGFQPRKWSKEIVFSAITSEFMVSKFT